MAATNMCSNFGSKWSSLPGEGESGHCGYLRGRREGTLWLVKGKERGDIVAI